MAPIEYIDNKSLSKEMFIIIMTSMFHNEDDLSDVYDYLTEYMNKRNSPEIELEPTLQNHHSGKTLNSSPKSNINFTQHTDQLFAVNEPILQNYHKPTTKKFEHEYVPQCDLIDNNCIAQNNYEQNSMSAIHNTTPTINLFNLPSIPISSPPPREREPSTLFDPIIQNHNDTSITETVVPVKVKVKRKRRKPLLEFPSNTPHDDNLYCAECNKQFSKPSYLKQHNNAHHKGPRIHKCSKCGKRFPTLMSLNKHILNHTNKPYICGVCKKTYRHKFDLERHMSVHGTGYKYSCRVCGKSFQRNDHLLIHEKIHLYR